MSQISTESPHDIVHAWTFFGDNCAKAADCEDLPLFRSNGHDRVMKDPIERFVANCYGEAFRKEFLTSVKKEHVFGDDSSDWMAEHIDAPAMILAIHKFAHVDDKAGVEYVFELFEDVLKTWHKRHILLCMQTDYKHGRYGEYIVYTTAWLKTRVQLAKKLVLLWHDTFFGQKDHVNNNKQEKGEN